MVFQEPLQSLQAEEGTSATLRCKLSHPSPVVWSKGGLELQADGHQEARQRGSTAELVLRDLHREDTGEYTCACGSQTTSATLTVTGAIQAPHAVGYGPTLGPPSEGTGAQGADDPV